MPSRAAAEFAWINVNETRIETDSFGPVEVPAKHFWGAQTQRSLVHFAIGSQSMPLAGLSLTLVTALTPRIGYDEPTRIAKAAHLNGTSLREEALASGLFSAGESDALVRPEAMLAPYD
jgi:fumarate hydratase class II